VPLAQILDGLCPCCKIGAVRLYAVVSRRTGPKWGGKNLPLVANSFHFVTYILILAWEPSALIQTIGFDYRTPSGSLRPLANPVAFSTAAGAWTHIVIRRTGNTYDYFRNGEFMGFVVDSSPSLPTAVGWTLSGRPPFRSPPVSSSCRSPLSFSSDAGRAPGASDSREPGRSVSAQNGMQRG
jgi:hypothetical protein